MNVAKIDESNCVGCAKCLPACPVDAIIGAPQHTHTIIAQECIGCGLCLPPCPMDCITLHTTPTPLFSKEKVKSRYQARKKRLQRRQHLPAPIPTLEDRKKEIQQLLSTKKY